MKKYRFFSLFLALALLLTALGGFAAAEEEQESSALTTETETAEGSAETAETETEQSGPQFHDYSSVLIKNEPYEADCKSALLIEMGTNTVLYAQDAEEQRYPASLTKIMTCLVAIRMCQERGKSLDDMVTVSQSAFADLDEAGSTAGIQPGDVISLRELLYCIMLESANEACNIVAEYLAGDVATYVKWMNETAKSLGCTHTHFANTHGLHDQNHYTTAMDLAIITEAALESDEFSAIIEKPTYTITAEQYSGERSITTTNMLLMEYSDYYYSRARGVKTGFTTPAGRCLITTASDSNMKLLAIVLGAEDDDYAADGLKYRSFVEAKELLQYGFQSFDFAQVLSRLDMTAQVVVSGGEQNSVVLYPSQDVSCLLPEDYDKEQITTKWELDDGVSKLQAPLEAGQKVGRITVSYQNVVIAETTLETLTAVRQRTTVQNVVAETGGFFKTTLPQLIRKYWWVFPAAVALIVFLVLVLIVRNNIIRARRRKQMRRRRQQEQQRKNRP